MLVPSQQTSDAMEAFEAARSSRQLTVSVAGMLEFLSLLRSLVNRRRLTPLEAEDARLIVTATAVAVVESPAFLLDRAWQLASQLGQSDVFDAFGYATAEWLGSEFWTSDRRFFNAAQAAGLDRVHLVP